MSVYAITIDPAWAPIDAAPAIGARLLAAARRILEAASVTPGRRGEGVGATGEGGEGGIA